MDEIMLPASSDEFHHPPMSDRDASPQFTFRLEPDDPRAGLCSARAAGASRSGRRHAPARCAISQRQSGCGPAGCGDQYRRACLRGARARGCARHPARRRLDGGAAGLAGSARTGVPASRATRSAGPPVGRADAGDGPRAGCCHGRAGLRIRQTRPSPPAELRRRGACRRRTGAPVVSNQLPGTVVSVSGGEQIVEVRLKLVDGTEAVAVITRRIPASIGPVFATVTQYKVRSTSTRKDGTRMESGARYQLEGVVSSGRSAWPK